MTDWDDRPRKTLTPMFQEPASHKGLGPYAVLEMDNRPMTAAVFSALSPQARDRVLLDRQSVLLISSALGATKEENVDQTQVHYNGASRSLGDLLAAGQAMTDPGKLALTREIINQNIEYVGPEADAEWTIGTKRPDAPMQDVIDYAQTLGESLKRGKGDCEDIAIAGAGLLERMGVSPERLHVMAGSVYDQTGAHQFDHANLAIQDAAKGRGSTVLEVVGHHVAVLPGGAYLQDGLAGQYFVPSVGIRGDGEMERFDTAGDRTTPKARFMDHASSDRLQNSRDQDMEYKNKGPALEP